MRSGYSNDIYGGESEVIQAVLDAAFANETNSIWYFDDQGNAFASLNSGDLSGDVITNDGVYHNFETESEYIWELTNNLSDEQFEDWLDNSLLDPVAVIVDSNGHIIDQGQFLADAMNSYNNYLNNNGLNGGLSFNFFSFWSVIDVGIKSFWLR